MESMEQGKILETTAAEAYEKFILPTFMLQMGKDAVDMATHGRANACLMLRAGRG